MLVLQVLLVKDLSRLRVGIIHAHNTVTPSVANYAVTLSQEFFLLLEFAEFI